MISQTEIYGDEPCGRAKEIIQRENDAVVVDVWTRDTDVQQLTLYYDSDADSRHQPSKEGDDELREIAIGDEMYEIHDDTVAVAERDDIQVQVILEMPADAEGVWA